MPKIPMPSPNGTNHERLFVSADPVTAYDSATFCGFPIDDPRPITSERIRARAVPRHPENPKMRRYAMDEADDNPQDDDTIELPDDALQFLKLRLSTDELDQFQKLLSGEAKLVSDPDNNIAMDRAARARDLAYGPSGDFLKRFPHALRLR